MPIRGVADPDQESYVGYQFVFWQQDDDAPDPQTVYLALMDRQRPTGLRPLPVDSILAAIRDWLGEPTRLRAGGP